MGDFFNKVKQGVEKGVATASVKSKEVLDATKIKSQIHGLDGQKKTLLEELGNIVYTMSVKGGFDEERLKTKCSAVATLDDQIERKEEELKEVHLKAQEALGKPKPITVCTCGEAIFESTKFCGKCGTRVGAPWL
jgi:SMC interacting uncharacterized protein involved in chromosome segregation